MPDAAPLAVDARISSSNIVTVSWSAVPTRSSGGLILGYKVFYKPTDSGEKAAVVETSGTSTSATLTNLQSYTNYNIQVSGDHRRSDWTLDRAARGGDDKMKQRQRFLFIILFGRLIGSSVILFHFTMCPQNIK